MMFDACWCLLMPDVCWCLMMFDACWYLLMPDDACWCMMVLDVWWCLMMFDCGWWCLIMFADVWWCLMMFADVWWCLMMFADVWWYLMMLADAWLCLMMPDDAWWCLLIFHDARWYLLMFDDDWWCLLMLDDAWWCLLMFDDVWWCVMMLADAWWCLMMCHDASWCFMILGVIAIGLIDIRPRNSQWWDVPAFLGWQALSLLRIWGCIEIPCQSTAQHSFAPIIFLFVGNSWICKEQTCQMAHPKLMPWTGGYRWFWFVLLFQSFVSSSSDSDVMIQVLLPSLHTKDVGSHRADASSGTRSKWYALGTAWPAWSSGPIFGTTASRGVSGDPQAVLWLGYSTKKVQKDPKTTPWLADGFAGRQVGFIVWLVALCDILGASFVRYPWYPCCSGHGKIYRNHLWKFGSSKCGTSKTVTRHVLPSTARALYKNVGCWWPGSLKFLSERPHVSQYICT